MELSSSSRVPSGIASRIRRLFLTDLAGAPGPSEERPGVRVFRAWPYWERNVRGVPFMVVSGGAFFLVLGGVLIGLTRALPWESIFLILNGIGWPLVLFPGKVAAFYPYAVEIEEGKGLRFYSALGDIYFPLDQVRKVRRSWLYGGWVISVKRHYGLLSGFLIHFAWGRQGRALAQAVRNELARSG